MSQVKSGQEPKKQYKPLTETDLSNYTDTGSFSKGSKYYRARYISDTLLRGDTIKARCEGSSGGPYMVQATLVPQGQPGSEKLTEWDCTCPRGGFCKHIVALLLAWINEPNLFEPRPAIADLLKERSREELVGIIERLLKRQPELETTVELLAQVGAKPGKGGAKTVDTSSMRRNVAAIFRNSSDEWGAYREIEDGLQNLIEISDSYAEAGQSRNAMLVYAAIVEEAIEHYEEVHDEGDIYGAISEAVEKLAEQFDAQPGQPADQRLTPLERQDMLKSLFAIWEFDGQFGDFSTNLAEVIAGNVSEDERAMVERWIREKMQPGNDFSSSYHNRALIHFLQVLKETNDFDEEDVLEEYRRAGMWEDVVNKLLELGRLEEAVKTIELRITEPNLINRFASTIARQGAKEAAMAVALVEEQLEIALSKPHRDIKISQAIESYRTSLGELYATAGRVEDALKVQVRRFEAVSNARTYSEVKATAQLPGQAASVWQELRPKLLKKLEKQADWRSLIAIYVNEREAQAALQALAEQERGSRISRASGWLASGNSVALEVAQVAEAEYPAEASRLYQDAIETLIASRGRENYQQAGRHLVKVKQLYDRRGKSQEWHNYIKDLRSNNTNLRALQEELDKLNLK